MKKPRVRCPVCLRDIAVYTSQGRPRFNKHKWQGQVCVGSKVALVWTKEDCHEDRTYQSSKVAQAGKSD